MKIGIDYTPAINQSAGIARYTRELTKHLLDIDKINEYTLYSFFGDTKKFSIKNDRVTTDFHNYPPQLLKSTLFFLKTLKLSTDFLINKSDIMHYMDFTVPISKKTPSIISVHDLIFLRFPQYFTFKNRNYMRLMAKSSIPKANAVIACSDSTKNDLIEFINIDEKKIHIIPLGVSENFKPSSVSEIKNMREKYLLPADYLLNVGTIEPRKNLINLLKSFAQLKKKNLINHKLVIAGKKGWKYDSFFETVKSLNVKNDLIFLDNFSAEDLPSIYSGATAFIYPSLYEGFGLPPLEALACGTPVICSNNSSLPEVVGDAALLVNPNDIDELNQAIETVIQNKNDLRSELSQKGLKQASKFSWEETARKTLAVYSQFS